MHISSEFSSPTPEEMDFKSEEAKNGQEKETGVISEISERMQGVKSEKVKNALGEWVDQLKMFKDKDAEMMRMYRLMGIKGDFSTLVKNPDAEIGQGMYRGWSNEEVKEFYQALYGEDLEE